MPKNKDSICPKKDVKYGCTNDGKSSSYNVSGLRKKCKQEGIKGYSNKNRDELVYMRGS